MALFRALATNFAQLGSRWAESVGVARIYDRLAKEALTRMLGATGRELVAERELAVEAQGIDLWFVPEMDRLAALAPFGLLLRIAAQGPAAFEFFHQAPSLDDFLSSLRKTFYLRQPARVPARDEEPWLWVIAAGRPSLALAELGLKREQGWPKGIYSGPRGMRLRLIVTSELPVTRETLVLRCLGAGKTLKKAQGELERRGLSDPIASIFLPLMVALHFEGLEHPDASDADTQEFLMDTRDIYEAWHKKVLDAGRKEGLDAGRKEGELRGGVRALLAVLSARGLSVSEAQLATIKGCRSPKRLEAWLRHAVSADTTEELLQKGSGRKRN